MAHSSHTRSNVLIDLFNLSDKRRTTMMYKNFPDDFYLPDGKNSRISQIVNNWMFGRQTPDGNQGVGVEISYLEHTYSTKHYMVDKTTGNISAIHQDNVKPTDFFACYGPFNLKELEFNVCRIADHHSGEDDSRLNDDRRWVNPNPPSQLQSAQPRPLRPFNEL